MVEDPELRTVDSEDRSTSVLNFKICTYQKVKGRVEKTYLDCVAWDSGAKIIAENFRKGDQILVDAFARNDRWTDKEGKSCSRVVFRVEKFYLTPFDRNEYDEEGNE